MLYRGSNCSPAPTIDGRIMLMPISCHFRHHKAFLVFSISDPCKLRVSDIYLYLYLYLITTTRAAGITTFKFCLKKVNWPTFPEPIQVSQT